MILWSNNPYFSHHTAYGNSHLRFYHYLADTWLVAKDSHPGKELGRLERGSKKAINLSNYLCLFLFRYFEKIIYIWHIFR